MKVSIVIPNYNGKHFMKPCLESLARQSFKDFEIIVVDNASQDGSVEYIEENYRDIEFIKLDKNYGFPKAVNVGIKVAKAEYVILLNNDTEVDARYVEELYKAISSDEKIFSCSSKMVDYKNRTLLDDAGDMYTIVGWGAQCGIGQSVDKYNKTRKVFTACAGAAIYRKKIFEEIGYFDENHFAYLEDIDVGYRARIYGYKNIFVPGAIVYHVGSGTSGSKYNDFKVRLAAKNSIYLNYKNMPILQLIINLPFLLFGYLVKMVFFAKKGYFKLYVRSLLEGIRTIKICKKVRFRWSHLFNYIQIEIELIVNTFIYAVDFVKRFFKKINL